ncbi:MAG: hypothetical protein HQK75_06790 [Candidatus Magnetomorum sp.]|nr:hypothetical protein [Candidatus Magnetomorum sp.]
MNKKKISLEQPLDEKLLNTIRQHLQSEKLPCSVAFDIAQKNQVQIKHIGQTADMAGIRLCKCQLGLFGYEPEKKKIKPLQIIEPALNQAIQDAQKDNRMTCKTIWHIAETMKMNKLHVSCACETLGLKIKNCQLGAF